MWLSRGCLVLLELAATVLAVPQPAVSADRRPKPDERRAEAIKNAFRVSWQAYLDHAFPHDTLHPLSNGFEDDRCVLAPLAHWPRLG